MTNLCDACSDYRARSQYKNLSARLEEVLMQKNYIRQLKTTFPQEDAAWIKFDYSERIELPRFHVSAKAVLI